MSQLRWAQEASKSRFALWGDAYIKTVRVLGRLEALVTVGQVNEPLVGRSHQAAFGLSPFSHERSVNEQVCCLNQSTLVEGAGAQALVRVASKRDDSKTGRPYGIGKFSTGAGLIEGFASEERETLNSSRNDRCCQFLNICGWGFKGEEVGVDAPSATN